MKVSVVLPTYNERENIRIIIPEIEKVFKENKIKGEILVVDDSSPDKTAEEAKRLNKRYGNVRVVLRKKKEGIGAALRDGYDRCRGDIIISLDADLSVKTSVIEKLIEKINLGNDLVVGSRYFSFGKRKEKHLKKIFQGIVSRLGNLFIKFVTGVNIHDFTLNYRAIRRNVWKKIKTKEKSNSFLLEMIVKSKFAGYKVSEIPVSFTERKYGKSKIKLFDTMVRFVYKSIELGLEYIS
jgi:dolichol-phosphate mannosyltransferase